jgi:RimJ/RimL family protein N-acetyltransferase
MRVETDRLTLRPLALDDAAFILELVNEPGWLRFIGNRGIRTFEAAQGYLRDGPIAMMAKEGIALGAVELKGEPAPVRIGICGLIQRENLPDVDLGFAFLARYTGQGYAREAAAATLAYGTRERRLMRIVALTDPENQRSIKLLQALNFCLEGDLRLRPEAPVAKLWVYGATSTGMPKTT